MNAWKMVCAKVAGVGLLGLSFAVLPVVAQEATQVKVAEIPDSPGATWSKSVEASSSSARSDALVALASTQTPSSQDANQASQGQTQQAPQPAPTKQEPVGTAA